MIPTASATDITGVQQIALTVSDVARAKTFYRDAVGLPFLFDAGPNLAFLDIGDVRLMLSAPEGDFKPGKGAMIYFAVADIKGAHAGMVKRGVAFVGAPHMIAKMPDHELWLAEFEDPDGNPLALMCEVASESSR
ncbi:MAG: VOC family protein [Gemmatimonadota bacterium]|nr:VOC family protein [Gemmatimonadota bacterium]